MRVVAACLLIALTAACGIERLLTEQAECERNRDCDDDEECDDGECVDDDDGDEGEGEEGEGETSPDAPQFLQFSTNTATLTNTSSVIFTAVLTDSGGIDDIIGGSLVNPTNNASYGSFQTSAAEGSYQMTLTWGAINVVQPIDFTATAQRGFKARFFDVGGHVAEQTINVTLTCNGSPACNGECGGARCGGGECTLTEDAVDENLNGICNNQCRALNTATDCGGCELSCAPVGGAGSQCALAEDNAGIFGLCSCTAGSCSAGSVCMGNLLENDARSFCATAAFGINDVSGSAEMGSAPVCNFDEHEATLFCEADGQSGTGAATATSGFAPGYDIDCSLSATDLGDCLLTYQDVCALTDIACTP